MKRSRGRGLLEWAGLAGHPHKTPSTEEKRLDSAKGKVFIPVLSVMLLVLTVATDLSASTVIFDSLLEGVVVAEAYGRWIYPRQRR